MIQDIKKNEEKKKKNLLLKDVAYVSSEQRLWHLDPSLVLWWSRLNKPLQRTFGGLLCHLL